MENNLTIPILFFYYRKSERFSIKIIQNGFENVAE